MYYNNHAVIDTKNNFLIIAIKLLKTKTKKEEVIFIIGF
jgi:hypothetical protein